MSVTRRGFLLGAMAAPGAVVLARRGYAAAPLDLKISHQFPGGSAASGDFRDRLCWRFATELEKRTDGMLKTTIYPDSSLMKTNAQFSAMRKGALDMSLVPLSYAGGEVAETNIGLMPGVVTNYQQGMSWKTRPIGKTLSDILADKGILFVSWIWQAGGVASRGKALVEPEDAQGR